MNRIMDDPCTLADCNGGSSFAWIFKGSRTLLDLIFFRKEGINIFSIDFLTITNNLVIIRCL